MASAPPTPPFPPSLSLVAAWHQREVALGGAPRDRILRLRREPHARLLAEHEHLAQLRARGRAVRRERTRELQHAGAADAVALQRELAQPWGAARREGVRQRGRARVADVVGAKLVVVAPRVVAAEQVAQLAEARTDRGGGVECAGEALEALITEVVVGEVESLQLSRWRIVMAIEMAIRQAATYQSHSRPG